MGDEHIDLGRVAFKRRYPRLRWIVHTDPFECGRIAQHGHFEVCTS